MFKFITSLTFLYAFSFMVLVWFGLAYYRAFIRNGYQRRIFPWVFLLITVACISFLYFNIHAPLNLKTFSNLEHHFIRLDGYRVAHGVELGKTDTVNNKDNPFNRFSISRTNGRFEIISSYAEDPFYLSRQGRSKLASVSFPAEKNTLSFQVHSQLIQLSVSEEQVCKLTIKGMTAGKPVKEIRRGITVWNLFKNDTLFTDSGLHANDSVVAALRTIYLLRDDFSESNSGELKFFPGGNLFKYAKDVQYGDRRITLDDLKFSAMADDNTMIGWGLGFPEKNKNQFFLRPMGADSFRLSYRYPVSYPLSEEPGGNIASEWKNHEVLKFLISHEKQMGELPAAFSEGFLFSAVGGDSTSRFAPVLLSYQKGGSGQPLDMKVKSLKRSGNPIHVTADKLIIPGETPGLDSEFSITDTFNWQFGNRMLTPAQWKFLLFGSLIFFFCLVFFSAWIKQPDKISWVWQILSCVIMLLLTTRFFLYWRYKSFPPYEGLDLPSIQQLNSTWNFMIIVSLAVLLGLLFGFGILRFLFAAVAKQVNKLRRPSGSASFNKPGLSVNRIIAQVSSSSFISNISAKKLFWVLWLFVIAGGGGVAFLSGFSPSVCRHLAALLMLLYFVFIYFSGRYSPLVSASDKSWWSINTSRVSEVIISNPVKVLLSLSLFGLFSFIDIGFALIFLNFLLFNEAFLLINYSIAGLSAGSRRNTFLFGCLSILYLLVFAVNLVYGPYIFKFVLELPQQVYLAAYLLFAWVVASSVARLLRLSPWKKRMVQAFSVVILFSGATIFFPKERIQEKAAMTKYRIDVLSMPADKAITQAYEKGDSYEPVIRAAQNQWFINTFIDEEHNPSVNAAGFRLLPHAPQNRGAKYNAQATDLVTSRFLIAEHGRWPVIFYLLILLVPVLLLASFYKLYPDFTNRINTGYASVTTGFSVLNYLLVTALLVILAATGRYIFFGQDLPFGSILSKQSVVFPSLLLIAAILFFRNIPLQQYPNKHKMLPGAVIAAGLAILLFFVKPAFNRNKEFGVSDLAQSMDGYIRSRLQPLWNEIDTAKNTRRLSLREKDLLFSAQLKKMTDAGLLSDAPAFLRQQLKTYTRSGYLRHLDANSMLYLDMNTGSPRLAVNDNYFHIEAPPHLQQSWRGAIFGDSTVYNMELWNTGDGSVVTRRITGDDPENSFQPVEGLDIIYGSKTDGYRFEGPCLVNNSGGTLHLHTQNGEILLNSKDTLPLRNPGKIVLKKDTGEDGMILTIQPDAFMRNYYVNGSRFYYYPSGNDFIWARNFAEGISFDYSRKEKKNDNVFVSLDRELTDSLSMRIKKMLGEDTAYRDGAEYAICIADGNGRLLAMPDQIKGLARPDPNDKMAFLRSVRGENGFIPQAELRKKTGNINLLRMNPGPGSTLKPVVFAAIASQLNLDWNAFASEGFSEKQKFFGGEQVAEYDFEKNNGRISSVSDYLRYSDNYYHSNLLLLGSYSKQSLQALLLNNFMRQKPEGNFHWPYFSYNGNNYWLNGFANWPGYAAGKANFGSDSSFLSAGLSANFGIHTYRNGRGYDRFSSAYDTAVFGNSYFRSGFILPEYALFDQKGTGMNLNRPNEVFLSSFRGHVKGSSQVMIPPVKMLDAFGKLASQNRSYSITLNPYAAGTDFSPFHVDGGVSYSSYLALIKEDVFGGMREALFRGTAAVLGGQLKNGAPYYYYAKTGTTGDEELKTKSKLFAIIISEKDIASPGFVFRKNKFFVIYFTSQNGPAKQNEKFQAEIIKWVEGSSVFRRYMQKK